MPLAFHLIQSVPHVVDDHASVCLEILFFTLTSRIVPSLGDGVVDGLLLLLREGLSCKHRRFVFMGRGLAPPQDSRTAGVG